MTYQRTPINDGIDQVKDEFESGVLGITQALADPLRLAVLQHLMAGPAAVSELMTATSAEQSRLSNHLAVLRNRNLVRTTRQGRQVVYELRDSAVGRLVESRGGSDAKYGTAQGARSDTTILLHSPADRREAVAVSIPRDSMVQIPDCPRSDVL